MATSLSILTYNVGLLDCHIFGVRVFSNPPYSKDRLPLIPNALRSTNADIVCLQECYDECHYKKIVDNLHDVYPFTARQRSGDSVKLHNGLIILSKYPIQDSYLIRYEDASFLESCFATKSSLLAIIRVPHIPLPICVVNIHTTAGGSAHPESPNSDICRERELKQSIDSVHKHFEMGKCLTLLVGDFNCGKEASYGNYKYVLDNGFIDLVDEYHIKENIPTNNAITWDPKNLLNKSGPHATSPPQRIDHILRCQHSEWNNWIVSKVRILFTEEVAYVKTLNKKCSLSDHYGLLLELQVNDDNSIQYF